jgi:D-glycero-D-manno-heptose 1,7-bisphosphate phosphatase
VLNDAPLRDGKPESPRGTDDLVVLPGVEKACATLSEAGFALIVVTNQPEIARGSLARETVDAINHELTAALPLDEIVVCPHDDADGCACRKPKPGMLIAAAARHGIDLQKSYLVGDRWRDIEAGQAAGAQTVFVERGYDERRPEAPGATVSDLTGATAWILVDAGKTKP